MTPSPARPRPRPPPRAWMPAVLCGAAALTALFAVLALTGAADATACAADGTPAHTAPLGATRRLHQAAEVIEQPTAAKDKTPAAADEAAGDDAAKRTKEKKEKGPDTGSGESPAKKATEEEKKEKEKKRGAMIDACCVDAKDATDSVGSATDKQPGMLYLDSRVCNGTCLSALVTGRGATPPSTSHTSSQPFLTMKSTATTQLVVPQQVLT